MTSSSFSLQGVLVCTIFMLVGPSLIITNQYILTSVGFSYPMFLSGLGVLFTGITARLLVSLGFEKIQRSEAVEGVLWFKRVLPVGLFSAAALAFGNIVYLYLDVGFIQMLKAFTPVIMVMTNAATRIEMATVPVIVSVAIISLGTATTCSSTPSLKLIGVLVMLLSQISESVRLAITQFFLQHLKFGVIEGSYVLAPAITFWLFLASAIFELPTMYDKNAFAILYKHPGLFLMSAFMGIGVNFISYFMIQFTSSLTMKILVQVRNTIMVVLGVIFYHEVITINQAIGYLIALIGFAFYNMAKIGMFDELTYEDVYYHRLMPTVVRCFLPTPNTSTSSGNAAEKFALISTKA